jgi:hypothetical protein
MIKILYTWISCFSISLLFSGILYGKGKLPLLEFQVANAHIMGKQEGNDACLSMEKR